jgi:hypothetical protein
MNWIMRHALLIACSLIAIASIGQQPVVPTWMTKATGFDPGGKRIHLNDQYHAQWAKAGHHNRFIGTYTCQARNKQSRHVFEFMGWADSTRAFFRMVPPQANAVRTQLCDLKADVCLFAQGDSAGTLRVKRVSERNLGRPMPGAQPMIWGQRQDVAERTLGRSCYQQAALASNDTLRFLLADGVPSPFLDLWEWMLNDYNYMPKLASTVIAGTDMPLRYEDSEWVLEVRSLTLGKQPCPNVDLHAFTMEPSGLAAVLGSEKEKAGAGSGSGRSDLLHGAPGTGTGQAPHPAITIDLPGRMVKTPPRIAGKPSVEGMVVMSIEVDRTGLVLTAIQDLKRSTTTSTELIEMARKAALATRFNEAANASEKQTGTITFRFRME